MILVKWIEYIYSKVKSLIHLVFAYFIFRYFNWHDLLHFLPKTENFNIIANTFFVSFIADVIVNKLILSRKAIVKVNFGLNKNDALVDNLLEENNDKTTRICIKEDESVKNIYVLISVDKNIKNKKLKKNISLKMPDNVVASYDKVIQNDERILFIPIPERGEKVYEISLTFEPNESTNSYTYIDVSIFGAFNLELEELNNMKIESEYF